MRVVPMRHSKSWLYWMLYYGIALTLLFWINRYYVQGSDFTPLLAFRFMLLAFGLSILTNGFGWLGGRSLWFMTTLGIIVGIVLMYYYSFNDPNGWQDLTSFLGLLIGVVIGLGAGLLTEVLKFIMKLVKK